MKKNENGMFKTAVSCCLGVLAALFILGILKWIFLTILFLIA